MELLENRSTRRFQLSAVDSHSGKLLPPKIYVYLDEFRTSEHHNCTDLRYEVHCRMAEFSKDLIERGTPIYVTVVRVHFTSLHLLAVNSSPVRRTMFPDHSQ